MTISEYCVVAIFYTVTNEQGEEIDTSGDEPLVYLHGGGNLIRGLEQELEGRAAGDSFAVVLEPDLAYGEINPKMINDVPRNLLSNIEGLRVGMPLESKSDDGTTQLHVVDHIGDDTVTLNANHPFAGMTLRFHVAIGSVREATQEEIEHRHVH